MKRNVSLQELFRRYLVLLVGFFLMAFGISLTLLCEAGTTPLSTLPNVFALRFTGLSFGTITFFWNILMIVAQILITRKLRNRDWLIQLLLSFVLSYLIDFTNFLLRPFHITGWPLRIGLLLAACLVLGCSISLTIQSKVVINCGEAIVAVIEKRTPFSFGTVKTFLDITYVALGALISYLFFHSIRGIGIGTLLTAFLTGFCINLWNRFLSKPISSFCELR